jgi:uncharacterized protein YqgV (UPF0045/DUF77 family)
MNSPILASVRITPLGIAKSSIREPVEEAINTLKKFNVTCRVNPTCTEMYGQNQEIFSAITNAVNAIFEHEDINRIMCDIHLDIRRFSRHSLPPYSEKICTEEDDE